jgi:predicted translin family RNA/ssDNA-binding protein
MSSELADKRTRLKDLTDLREENVRLCREVERLTREAERVAVEVERVTKELNARLTHLSGTIKF